MKRTILTIFFAAILLSVQSCRETTEEKTEEAIEAMGEDIEDNTQRAAEELEEGAERVEREIEEEVHTSDDVNPGIEQEEEY